MSEKSPEDSQLLKKTADLVFADVYDDAPLTHLLPPRQVFVTIYTTQGIIDNGGFRYFFENDFPNHPPYSYFSDAYREIGVADVAGWIDRAALLFGFPDPHLDREARDNFLQEHCADDECEICKLGDRAIDARHRVWSSLAAHVRRHQSEFTAA